MDVHFFLAQNFFFVCWIMTRDSRWSRPTNCFFRTDYDSAEFSLLPPCPWMLTFEIGRRASLKKISWTRISVACWKFLEKRIKNLTHTQCCGCSVYLFKHRGTNQVLQSRACDDTLHFSSCLSWWISLVSFLFHRFFFLPPSLSSSGVMNTFLTRRV